MPVSLSLNETQIYTPERKFGYNTDVGTAYETIWAEGGLYPWPTTADTLTVVSSGEDDAAGANARTVLIYGLASDWSYQTEAVTLSAASNAVTTKTFRRVNRVAVTTVGTAGVANENIIRVHHTTSNDVLAHIPAGSTFTQQVVYTVPLTRKLVVVRVRQGIDVSGTKTGNFRYTAQYNNISETEPVRGQFAQVTGIQGTLPLDLEGVTLEAKVDLEAQAFASGSGSTCTGGFDAWLM